MTRLLTELSVDISVMHPTSAVCGQLSVLSGVYCSRHSAVHTRILGGQGFNLKQYIRYVNIQVARGFNNTFQRVSSLL